MNLDEATTLDIAQALECTVSCFPQTYPGLPLSPVKLTAAAFQPIITNCVSYLPGWCAKLLSRPGRLVLISSVLDSLATYFMYVFKLPKKMI